MFYLKQVLKKHYLFLVILFFAFILRTYRLEYLTTFGRDQGIDFLSVKDMIIFHKITLIGIKVSLADFFQGPIYLYLLIPLFYLMKLNPIAGAYSAVIISLATMSTLYFIVYKMFNIRSAILASAFFAMSPQLVMFGNTPLYQNFTPLFILLGIWFLFLTTKAQTITKRYLCMFLCGLTIGIGMELHFLVISLMLAILIYLILYTKPTIKLIIFFLLGLFLAVSPTILFEIRHNFLNLHLLLDYFGNRGQESSFLSIWFERIIYFATHDYNFLILLTLPILIYILSFKKFNYSENFPFLKKLALINLLIIFLFAVKLSSFGTHYLLPFLMLLLIIIPVFLSSVKSSLINLICFLFLSLNLLITISQLNNNHGYFMPDGWSLNKIEQTADIIATSAKTHPNFNVASLLDGDTRTYPIRYMLSLTNEIPGDYTTYPQNNYLYVVARNVSQIDNSTVWEIQSLRPFKIEEEWQMGDGIILYLLAKIKT